MNDVVNFFSAGSGGGEYLSWKAQLKRWVVDGEECELKRVLIDPTTLRTGWGKLAAGAPPDFVWSEVPGSRTDQPSPDHKPAFSLQVYVSEKFGAPEGHSGWRDFRSNGRGARDGLTAIWKQMSDEMGENAGKVASVDVKGAEEMAVGPGRTAVPTLSIRGWVEAPVPAPAPVEEDAGDVF